ncbi:hypothetical protein FHR32_002770 [Streptosporangium album]|uniref:Uncharacterized protein n=1 Tax=Streptosporangium album TaxID=47479 RepID=A0A7W7RUL6_9ACTN|nr:hypothetical protein [Streptosporangium album]MBB4938465.1 hypothetical protein [Streptosporangium album]
MLDVQLAELLDGTPSGVGEALDLVTGFDDALAHGFARLGEERAAALTAMAGAMAATPLGERMGEAAGKLAAGSIADEHLTALAGGRAALFGAVHDALLARLDAALGRARASWEGPASPVPPVVAADNLLSGCRSWLHELAITGWRGVDHDLVSASGQAIEALSAEPGLRRPAVLLDGLAAELRASCPVQAADRLPVRRWADLWTRALLLSQAGGLPGGPEAAGTVSGRLLILGVDVHEHGTAVQIQVHGILEPSGGAPSRLVRTSVAAAKVDTIVGPALWRLLTGFPVLLGALAERRSLDVTDLPLLDSGDLVWHDDRARAGEPVDPFAAARVQLAGVLAPAVPPLDRHPVRIAEPVLVEGYKTATGDGSAVTLDLGGSTLAVDTDRLPACGPLTSAMVAASSACIGLVRWDGGRWTLQPLAVQATVKRKAVEAHNGDWALGPTDPKAAKAEARAGDAVAVLRERAGRLLRK